MRLIGTLPNENQAHRFTAYLKRKGIEANCEVSFDAQTEHLSYHLWVHDEDQIGPASAAFEHFLTKPNDPDFNISVPTPTPPPVNGGETVQEAEAETQRVKAPITSFFLALCVFIFLLSWYQEAKILSSPDRSGNLLLTPIVETLFFDVPQGLDEGISKGIDPGASIADEIKAEEANLKQMTYWHGAYDWFLDKLKGQETAQNEGPLFYKIRQGEFWRLFTPVLLHAGILHILFNMIWLWVLGVPIEQRVGMFRTILITLILGVGSNVCQYLMGGPFFLGYSGIVVGFAGFIWMREKIAPWEGYPLQKSTVLFLLLFVGGMFAIQFTSFALQLFTDISFTPNIANTGHISGGLIGMLLGRTRLFSRGAK